jgi:hypothetical protein
LIQGATAGTAVIEKKSTGKMSVQVSVDYYYKSHAYNILFQDGPTSTSQFQDVPIYRYKNNNFGWK